MASLTPPNGTQRVPFFRPSLTEAELREVFETLRSGWLTTGSKTKRFEQEFGKAVGAKHAVAVNSCTAALHLAVEALGLARGHVVLVPTMTFAATAEVVRYQKAIPLLVDCDPVTLNMSLPDAARKLVDLQRGRLAPRLPDRSRVVGIMPVHVGGRMMDIAAVRAFASTNDLWVVEDAAHAFPAAWRPEPNDPWQQCGERTAAVTCFSFYANKTITTGEGGMAVTDDDAIANRMRMMSLHGLSQDAWERYSRGGSWDYQIVAPGYKYNLTDIAASIGLHQLQRAEQMRRQREEIAHRLRAGLADVDEIELPGEDPNRVHAWHLFPIRLRLDLLSITRGEFIDELTQCGVGSSVHWRPLHLHPYYRETFGWKPEEFPIATAVWERLVSLPIFPGMRDEEVLHVISSVTSICRRYGRGMGNQPAIQRHAGRPGLGYVARPAR